ncbi:uncharacterized protein LOC112165899 [Rosa chinensis]|uniref:uncharacterized protein LOC112165899 n=1 Tax=Rosa chinensis TaxID=74649 RepID=UPI000D093197|nr:uncharacterized protein LOC112165899 [Rosa chinensis]
MVVELYSLSVGEREYILALIQNIFLGTSRASHCFQVRFRVEVSLFCLVQLRKENNQITFTLLEVQFNSEIHCEFWKLLSTNRLVLLLRLSICIISVHGQKNLMAETM